MKCIYPVLIIVGLIALPIGLRQLRPNPREEEDSIRLAAIETTASAAVIPAQPAIRDKVLVAEAKPALVENEITVSGTVEPINEVPLYSEVPGTVQRVLVQVGDEVRAGQILAELTSSELDQQIALGQRRVQQAEAARRMSAGELDHAHKQIEERQAQIRLRQQLLLRTERLIRYGALPKSWAADDFAALEAAQTTLREAELAENLVHSRVRAACTDIETAQAELDATRQLKEHLVVRAPFDGVITQRQAEIGGRARPESREATPLFMLEKRDRMRVVLMIPSRAAHDVDLERQALECVVTGHATHTFLVIPSSVTSVAEGGQSGLRTELQLPNPVDDFTGERMLVPGDVGSVTLRLGTSAQLASVPLSAIKQVEGHDHVLLVEQNHVCREVAVDIYRTEGAVATLFEGDVQVGDLVVAEGPARFRTGQRLAAASIEYHQQFRPTRFGTLPRDSR